MAVLAGTASSLRAEPGRGGRLPRAVAWLLYGLTLGVVFLVALSSLTRFDFWWYLKSGEYILQTRSIPGGDPFSFTAQGRPWINHMWLTQVILYWLYESVGRIPIIIGKSLLVAATFGIVLATCLRRGAHPVLAVLLVTLAALAGKGYWHVRPQIITYLLMASYLYLLREGWEGRLRTLIWLPLLMVAWANLHAGFVTGLGLLGVITVGAVLERLLAPERPDWRPVGVLVLVSAVTAVATLLNPFGLRAVLFPFEVVSTREFMRTTIEWFSPNFHDPQYRPFEAMILLSFASLGLGSARLRVTDVLLVLTFTHLGVSSIRHIPLYAVAVTPALADALHGAVERVWSWRGAWLRGLVQAGEARLPSIWPLLRAPLAHAAAAGVMLVALLAGYGALAREPWTSPFVQDLNEFAYPKRTVEFMKREHVPAPLFNVYVWGGYELWRLYPDYQVFFDGRTHVYGERIVEDYLEVASLKPGWRAVLDRWKIQSVLTHPGYALSEALYASPEWRLVFVDREALLFVRNVPTHQALFDRIGPVDRPASTALIRPALDSALQAAERGDDDGAIRRFRDVLSLDPENPVALYSLGLLLDRRGDRPGAERLWQELQRSSAGTELAAKAARELARRP